MEQFPYILLLYMFSLARYILFNIHTAHTRLWNDAYGHYVLHKLQLYV